MKPERPELLTGVTRKVATPLGSLYVTINTTPDGKPFEVFAVIGKAGAPILADSEAIGRLATLALRAGVSIEAVHRQLRGISSDRAGNGHAASSIPDGVGLAIEKWLSAREVESVHYTVNDDTTVNEPPVDLSTFNSKAVARFHRQAPASCFESYAKPDGDIVFMTEAVA